MSSTGPADIVNAFIAAVEQRDLELALTYLAQDVEYDNVPMAKVHGIEGVRATLAPFVARFEEIAWPVTHLLESGTADDGAVDRAARGGPLPGARREDHAVAGLLRSRRLRVTDGHARLTHRSW
jgi:hypothetical protein